MKHQSPPDNPFLSLVINILLPVMVLHKGGAFVGAKWTLIIALCFPLFYGIQDYVRRRHKNYVSLVGLINIMLTGSLALASLNGIWFCFKEATLPFILGCLTLGSAWTSNPAAKMMFCNPNILNMDLIEERLDTPDKQGRYMRDLRQTSVWLSISFFISSIANFIIAYHIFEDIDPKLSHDEMLTVLNGQLAHMTWMGFGMVALPLMVFSGVLVYRFLNRLSALVEVPVDSLMKA